MYFTKLLRKIDLTIALIVIGLVMAYSFAADLGINTPEWKIAQRLGGKISTAHFDIYYDKATTKRHEVHELARQHEFRYAQMSEKLQFRFPQRISSFVYPSAEVRAELTGARHTSVAPLWLRQPQMHLERSRYETVMPHELAHVFSRSFGISFFNASTSIGLIEGFAVAVEPPDGLPSPHEQVASAVKNGMSKNLILAISEKLSPQGFWGGRGAVSYTTMGSFVQFLIEKYGIERFKNVYAWGNFADVYQKEVATLAQEWADFLKTVPIDTSQQQFTKVAFGRLSLFEQKCPHYIPPYLRKFRQAVDLIEEENFSEAQNVLYQVCTEEPNFEEAHQLQAQLSLHNGDVKSAQAQLIKIADKSPKTWRLLGDAHAILGDSTKAKAFYDSTLAQLSPFAYESRLFVEMRKYLVQNAVTIEELSRLGLKKPARLVTFDVISLYHIKTYFQGISRNQSDEFYRQILEDQMLMEKVFTSKNPDLLFQWARWALRVQRFDMANSLLSAAKQHRSNRIWQRYIDDWQARVAFEKLHLLANIQN